MTTIDGTIGGETGEERPPASWVSSRTWRGGSVGEPEARVLETEGEREDALQSAPDRARRRGRRSRVPAIFASAPRGGSESSTPVYDLRISASGQ